MARNRTRKKEKIFVPQGNAYIRATFNNTIVTLTDNSGNVISQSSSGAKGFRGSRRRRVCRWDSSWIWIENSGCVSERPWCWKRSCNKSYSTCGYKSCFN